MFVSPPLYLKSVLKHLRVRIFKKIYINVGTFQRTLLLSIVELPSQQNVFTVLSPYKQLSEPTLSGPGQGRQARIVLYRWEFKAQIMNHVQGRVIAKGSWPGQCKALPS